MANRVKSNRKNKSMNRAVVVVSSLAVLATGASINVGNAAVNANGDIVSAQVRKLETACNVPTDAKYENLPSGVTDISHPTDTPTALGGATCADGFAGEAKATCPLNGGAYIPSGCELITACTVPSAIPTGFKTLPTGVIATTTHGTATVVQDVECAANYTGTAKAKCPAGGSDYELSGCELITSPITCAKPTNADKYQTSAGSALGASYESTDAIFADVIKCAAGKVQTATPAIGACTTNGDYTLTGCADAPATCAKPASVDAKYKNDAHLLATIPLADFTTAANLAGATCAENFTGTVKAHCSAAGAEYTLSGCAAQVVATSCAKPATITGYTALPASVLLSAHKEATLLSGAACATGYSGKPKALCPADGSAYVLSGCAQAKKQIADVPVKLTLDLPGTTTLEDVQAAVNATADLDTNTVVGAWLNAAETSFAAAAGVPRSYVSTKSIKIATRRQRLVRLLAAQSLTAVMTVTFPADSATTVEDLTQKTTGTDNTFAADFSSNYTDNIATETALTDACANNACAVASVAASDPVIVTPTPAPAPAPAPVPAPKLLKGSAFSATGAVAGAVVRTGVLVLSAYMYFQM